MQVVPARHRNHSELNAFCNQMSLFHQGMHITITVIIVHLSALDSNSLKGWGPWNTSLHGSLEAPIPYLPQQFVSDTVIKSCKSIFYILKNDFQHCQLNSPCFWLQRFTRNSHPSGKLRFKSTPIQDEPGFATWKKYLWNCAQFKMKVLTVFFLHILSLLRVYSYLQPTVIILIVKVIIKHSDCHKSDNNFVVFLILISIFYSPIRIGKRNNVPLESV